MNHKQKNSNLPMFVITTLRHGGCYERYLYYLDMDGDYQALFSDFYESWQYDFYQTAGRLDIVHGSTNHHWYVAFCRTRRTTGSRCLSSVFSRSAMEQGKAVADSGKNNDQNLLSQRHDYPGIGRYLASSQRQKDQRSGILARCGSFDQEQDGLCLGIEPGGVDLADPTAMGRRTVGIADQYEIASKKTGHLDRIGRADDKRTGFTPLWREKNFATPRLFREFNATPRYTPCRQHPEKNLAAVLAKKANGFFVRKKWPAMFAIGRK